VPDATVRSRRRRGEPGAGAAPLSAPRKWRAITLATLVLVPGYWAMLAGIVTVVAEDEGGIPNPGAAIAFGVALIPFVFIVLAFLSEHPHAPVAVLKAMGMALLVGIFCALADPVTGIVGGVSAGGAFALRPEPDQSWRVRGLAVAVATVYTLVLVRTVDPVALVVAPVFPFTALGLADHLAEWRQQRGTPPD
jgi:hypothetical protein